MLGACFTSAEKVSKVDFGFRSAGRQVGFVQDEKHVHHRRNRATIGRRFRCAGDLPSRPPRNQPTTTRIRSLPPASPADSFSRLAAIRAPFRAKTHRRASLSHGAPVHRITRTKRPPRRRSLNSSWLVELTPLTNGSGPFHHRHDRDNPSWWSTRWLFPNRPDDAKNC